MTEPNAAGAAVSAPEDVYTDKKRALFDKLYAFLNPSSGRPFMRSTGRCLFWPVRAAGKRPCWLTASRT